MGIAQKEIDMAILNRTTKTTDKPQAQAQAQPDIDRLSRELAEAEQQVNELTQALASVDQVMQAQAKADILRRQVAVLRDRAWQSKVNTLIQQHAQAHTEWETLTQEHTEEAAQDEALREELHTRYSWDTIAPGEEWIERRIVLLGSLERLKWRWRLRSERISVLLAEMTRCTEELETLHKYGVKALDMNSFELHPDRRAAGPDGMWIGGIFTPAPPATDDTPPTRTPIPDDGDEGDEEWITENERMHLATV